MSTAFAGAVQGTDGRPLDQIRLTGLSATGHHGVFEHERLDGQLFRADVVLHLDTRPAAAGDDLADTVSYAVVAEDVVAVLAGSPVDLIETVAERVAAAALRHPAVVAVDVAVHKPQAPIAVPFDDVEVVVRRDRVKVPVVPDVAPRVVPIPVGSITPAVLGNVAVTEPAAPQDQHVVMPPSIPPVSPAPAPDRSPDQGVFAATAEDLGPAADDVPHTGGVSDQEFVDALDSFYSAPQDALSAPAESFEPVVDEPGPVAQTDRTDQPVPEVAAEPTPLAEATVPEAVVAPSDVGEPASAPVAETSVAPPAASDAPAVPATLAEHEVPAPGTLAERAAPVVDGPDASGGHPLPDDVAPVPHQGAAENFPGEQAQPIAAPVPAEPSPASEPGAVAPPPAASFAAAASSGETGPVPPLPEPGPLAVPAPLPVRAAPEVAAAPAEPTPAAAPAAPEPEPVPAPVLDRLDEAPAGFVPVVLALGANLGDAQQTLRDAVTDLDRISGLEITDVSPLARTAAVGGPEQPDYLNAILLARTTLAPRALLHAIQGVENAHGRVRAERNGPRTLDVDLIVFGTVTEFTEDLELPHPRAHERAFVLEPWSQIAPDAVLPGLGGGPVAALAATAPDRGGIRWLALDWLTDAEPEPEAAPVTVRTDEAPAAPAVPPAAPAVAAPTPQAAATPEAQDAAVVPEQERTTAATQPPAPDGAAPPTTPQDAVTPVTPAAPAPAQAPAHPFVPEQPAAAPVQAPTPQAPAPTPERAAEEAGPFVPAFHPVHPQDGQEPPHAQVPPLWADVSQSAPAVEQRAQVAQAPAAPEEPVTPQFHPVHQTPASPFEPQPDPVAAEQQGSQPVPPSPQAPITGVPMSFPAELRGPSS
ncbi:2-amino-4-hydroxy-6-hydroxymethyldihydropteridine diphosphokinase [Oerskovia turbata]|uniref:2-amino-4-hydroxy-6- hydroxymethyldihydropteridine diphosphokinase n=1 Tax=Oerskovia turbata TaxID=1713 RepID=UPI000B0DF001|nr:2-amino-4-hydroxy-6-hydroxymethyldihydropteridine diphosphokinase [Oerskovia turbata]